jgi:hypothetical protein
MTMPTPHREPPEPPRLIERLLGNVMLVLGAMLVAFAALMVFQPDETRTAPFDLARQWPGIAFICGLGFGAVWVGLGIRRRAKAAKSGKDGR